MIRGCRDAGFLRMAGFGMTGLIDLALTGFGLVRCAVLFGGGAISKSVGKPRSSCAGRRGGATWKSVSNPRSSCTSPDFASGACVGEGGAFAGGGGGGGAKAGGP